MVRSVSAKRTAGGESFHKEQSAAVVDGSHARRADNGLTPFLAQQGAENLCFASATSSNDHDTVELEGPSLTGDWIESEKECLVIQGLGGTRPGIYSPKSSQDGITVHASVSKIRVSGKLLTKSSVLVRDEIGTGRLEVRKPHQRLTKR